MATRINCSFDISGSGRRKSTGSFTVTYDFSFYNTDEKIWSGSTTYNGQVNSDGKFEYNGVTTIPFILDKTIEYSDNRKFKINADYNITATKNTVRFTKNNLTITEYYKNVWIEFDNDGVLRDADLIGLEDGWGFFGGINVGSSFSYSLPHLTNGQIMFQSCTSLTSFLSPMPALTNADRMFQYCSNLVLFQSSIPSLVKNVSSMFSGCHKLETFRADLSSLQDGSLMFQYCDKLSIVDCNNLNSLTNGWDMFYDCTSLTKFQYDLPELINGYFMFSGTGLTKFSRKLDKLQDGAFMFNGCKNLTSFSSDLPSLTDGDKMFYGCKLDETSVRHIINCIKTKNTCSEWAELYLGVNDSLKTNSAFRTFLGLGQGYDVTETTNIQGYGGATWKITIQWNK